MVKAIREAFGAAPNAAVTAWVSLAEALIYFYSQPGPQAIDRLKRACAEPVDAAPGVMAVAHSVAGAHVVLRQPRGADAAARAGSAAAGAAETSLRAIFGASKLRETVRAMTKVGSTRNRDAGIGAASISWFVPALAGPIADGRR